jgi:hypothetical protein
MTNMIEMPIVFTHSDTIRRGRVLRISGQGFAQVQLLGAERIIECAALQSSERGLSVATGDEVLVWLEQSESPSGVVLGRIGAFQLGGARPQSLTLEAEEDIVIRNKSAKIRISSAGDIEIVGKSFTSRSQRLLRLLAPLIKLN